MLAATGMRLCVGMLTFIILARFLGPAHYGVIASAIAYCAFASILSDFGFGVSGLRRAAADVEGSKRIIGDAMAAKLALFVLVSIVGGAIVIAVLPAEWLAVYALVHIGATANGLAELHLIAARARRRFLLEGRLVIASSVMMLAIFGGVTAATRDVTAAAAAFAFTRTLYLVIIRLSLGDWVEPLSQMGRSWQQMLDVVRRGKGYAVDSVLTSLSGQADVLMFAILLTPHEFGIYQAGARLAQVFVSFAPVLSSVYLPGLAAAAINKDDAGFQVGSRRISLEFAALALAGGIGFLIVGPLATPLLYGERYDALSALWPGFAAFALLRFGAAGYGIQLAALGHVRTRVSSSLVSIAFLALLTTLLLPTYRLSVAPLLLAAGALPSIIILGTMLARDPRSSKLVRATLPALLVTAAVFVLL